MNRRQRQRARHVGARKSRGAERTDEVGLSLTRRTAVYGTAGVLSAGLGFFFLSQGSINLAPVLLLVGFLVFFPLALVK